MATITIDLNKTKYESINLANKSHIYDFVDDYKLKTKILKGTQLYKFLATGQSTLLFNKHNLIKVGFNRYTRLVEGIPVKYGHVSNSHIQTVKKEVEALAKNNHDAVPPFVVIPYSKSQKFFAILNGDETPTDYSEGYGPTDSIGGLEYTENDHITISFECLRRFYGKATTLQVAKRLAKGEIKFLDFVSDDQIELTKAECAKKDKDGVVALKPPKVGYTYVTYGYAPSGFWHRPATALLYDTKNKFSILLGQDEDSYFGVELADNPKTIETAFNSLIPKEARGKPFRRQGEWFVVPVTEKDMPYEEDVVLNADSTASGVFLPRKSDDSAKHFVYAQEIVVDKKGKVFAKDVRLSHENDDHADLTMEGWATFYENTAVRSFSVEGVD